MARSSLYLADCNILLRLLKSDHPEFPLVRGAIRTLTQRGMTPAYTLQNMTEFWNASTRPKERNGFGLTVEETERNAQDITLRAARRSTASRCLQTLDCRHAAVDEQLHPVHEA
jgi:hypothetical protein